MNKCLNTIPGKFVLFLFIIFRTTPSSGQVSLFFDNEKHKIPGDAVYFFTDSSKDHSWKRFKEIEHQLKAYPENKFYVSYKNQQVWIKINFRNIKPAGDLEYLLIRNPHINYLNVWLTKGDRVVKEFEPTGDRTRFKTRPIAFSDFLFPLGEDSLADYSAVLMIDKRNEVINIPLYGLTEKGLLHYTQAKNWTAGLFIGIGFFLFLFNVFLYLNMRDRSYVYYGIYIVLGFLYIFSDMGFTFMYFFPNNPLLSDFTRPVSIALATPVYLLFCMELLETRKTLPKTYKWMVGVLLAYVVLLAASLVLAADTGPIRVILSGLSYIVLNFLMISNLVIGWKSFKKGISYSLYIIAASFVLMIFLFLFMLYLSGNIPDTFINRNLMRISIAAEISILTLVLTRRFKKYKVASENLLRQVNEQQVQIFKTTTDYQEKEMQRLSSLLHDSVGARLSALRFNLESGNKGIGSEKITRAITDINELANDVRRFSHSFSPILLQKRGLREALGNFINPINEGGNIYIQFEIIGSQDRVSFRYELLVYNIIQELIHNIIKHSGASEAIVQLMLEEQVISIYVEDDGLGFEPGTKNDGLGFAQIKQLVTFVNGTLLVDSAENKGTRISIEFTVLPDEKKYPDTHS
jgi:two-component system, sensor histidine kinase LadS